MKRACYCAAVLGLLAFVMPSGLAAQSDDFVSLGDVARSLRKPKQEAAAPVVIDNDNLSKIMDEVENHRLNGTPLYTLDSPGNNFKVSLPDGTCSLSFNADVSSLLAAPYVPEELPQSQLGKLEGPARIDGDQLQVSVFNGTNWNLKEITIGLTIVRRAENASLYGNARLLPATIQDEAQTSAAADKPSDLTVLFHLKGSAAPMATTIFREKLSASLAPGQEWHWAIVNAKGVPPSPFSDPASDLPLSAPSFPGAN